MSTTSKNIWNEVAENRQMPCIKTNHLNLNKKQQVEYLYYSKYLW